MNEPSTSGGNDIASQAPETLICPECGGALSIKEHGRLVHYECHVGHQFGMESLRYAYGEKTEQTLWAALRALKEQAVLLEQMAGRTPNARLREEYGKQAEESREYADNVKEMLLTMHTPIVPGRL
jgi:two-component system chemotaxis response regulator CheB